MAWAVIAAVIAMCSLQSCSDDGDDNNGKITSSWEGQFFSGGDTYRWTCTFYDNGSAVLDCVFPWFTWNEAEKKLVVEKPRSFSVRGSYTVSADNRLTFEMPPFLFMLRDVRPQAGVNPLYYEYWKLTRGSYDSADKELDLVFLKAHVDSPEMTPDFDKAYGQFFPFTEVKK